MPQPQLVTIFDIEEFKGIDNSTDSAEMGKGYMSEAINVYVNDEKKLVCRPGYESVIAGASHSLWSQHGICLVVRSGYLCLVDDEYAVTNLVAVDVSGRMDYVYQNGRVYFTNGSSIGYYLDGSAYSLSDPALEFKRVMPAGQLIEFYNGRMLVARDNVIYISDAAAPHYYDIRNGWRPLSGRITMLKSVVDGVYIGAGYKTYFALGPDFLESTLSEKTGSAVMEGTALKIDSEEVTGMGLNSIVVWTSEDGVFIGYPQGRVKNVTWDVYTPDAAVRGAAIYNTAFGLDQYIVSYELPEGLGDGDIDIVLPEPSISSLGA